MFYYNRGIQELNYNLCFVDELEPGTIITMKDLEVEYNNLVDKGEIDKTEKPFYMYVHLRRVVNGGTLIEIGY